MQDREPADTTDEKGVTSLAGRRGLARSIYLLPNLITTGALFSGFYAIVAAMNGAYEYACIAIVIAGFLDALDGQVARLTNTQSSFGLQYDSLSDLIAFGVAPAILLYRWTLSELGKFGWIVAFLYVVCTALRLAKFNTTLNAKIFYGLASPAAAGTMATMVWTWLDVQLLIQTWLGGLPLAESSSIPVAIFTVIVALLMVSNVAYYNPKNIKGTVPFVYMLAFVLLFIVVAIYPPGILFCIGIIYGLSGPVQALIRRLRR